MGVGGLPSLVFSRGRVIRGTHTVVGRGTSETPVNFGLLPRLFALARLRDLCRTVCNRPVSGQGFHGHVTRVKFVRGASGVSGAKSQEKTSLCGFGSGTCRGSPGFGLWRCIEDAREGDIPYRPKFNRAQANCFRIKGHVNRQP